MKTTVSEILDAADALKKDLAERRAEDPSVAIGFELRMNLDIIAGDGIVDKTLARKIDDLFSALFGYTQETLTDSTHGQLKWHEAQSWRREEV
jgi:uncharacterized tellurite resistance protein B-like protein